MINIKTSKTATKSELADYYNISVKTFNNWLKPILPKLRSLGYTKKNRIFNKKQLDVIINHLGE